LFGKIIAKEINIIIPNSPIESCVVFMMVPPLFLSESSPELHQAAHSDPETNPSTQIN
jgi:hypothetical protein